MSRNTIPLISLGQYEILHGDDGIPVAYASWAYFSEDAELRYIRDPSLIRLEDWNLAIVCGLWITFHHFQ